MSHRTILHVDMNAFFASIEQATHPALRDKPIAVVGAAHRTVVLAASYPAKRRGVTNGSSKFDAARNCPDITFVTSSPSKYMDTSRRIVDLFYRYTPIVEVCSIDEAFLDVTGSLYLFGDPHVIARAIKKDIAGEFTITCSVGIAPNKLMAKLAANLQKPDGLVEITPDELPARLEPIPVEKICGIGPRLTAWLADRGIRTCGELQKVPREYLVRRFGVAGEWVHNAVFGRDDSPVVPEDEAPAPRSVGHSMTLMTNATTRDDVRTHLLRLCEMVGRRLRMQRFSGRTVAVYIRDASFASRSRRLTCDAPMRYADEIHRAACTVFDAMPMPDPVRCVGVSVSSLVRDYYQLSIFPDQRAKINRILAADAVNNKYGEFTLTPVSLLSVL